MRRRALQQLITETDLMPIKTRSPLSGHCYRTTRLKTSNNGDTPRGAIPDRGKQVFLLLQCGLDFTVVVPASPSHPLSWHSWRSCLGRTKDGSRLHQHVTRNSSGITLQEPRFSDPPRIDQHPDGNGGRHPGWVNNFGLIAEGDIFHLFTNKPNEQAGSTRKYWFGQKREIWTL